MFAPAPAPLVVATAVDAGEGELSSFDRARGNARAPETERNKRALENFMLRYRRRLLNGKSLLGIQRDC